MKRPTPAYTLTPRHARQVMLAAQGLPAAPGADLLPTLERTGFVRTLGGVDVYLAARARVPGMTRADLDAAVAANRVQVVPAARGCIYLVPRRHVAAALRFADLRTRARAKREHEKAGIRPGELDDVGAAVVETLGAQGPLTTSALRAALPDGTARSLGAPGKKVGISSTLPPALRQLEFAGRLERTLEAGRLDTERYLWRVPTVNPFDESPVPEDVAELNARIGEVFFRAAGLATVKQFAAWAGIPQRDAKAALERLDVLPLALENDKDLYFALEELRDALEDDAPAPAGVALLPFEDNLVALHGGPAVLTDPAHHGIEVPVWGRGKGTTVGDAKHSALRSVVAGGELAGFWEFDPDAEEVAVACFAAVDGALGERLADAAADTGRFLARDLGHGKSFSLDTDDDLRKRAGIVRGLA